MPHRRLPLPIGALLVAASAAITAGTPAAEPPVREGPTPVRPGDHGIGRHIGDLRFTDLEGRSWSLAELAAGKIAVFAMTSTSCPLSRKYLPRLAEMSEASSDRVAWILVNPVATDKQADMRAAAADLGKRATYVHDSQGRLAAALGGVTTTDVVVLTRDRTVAYHGAIDDQYGFGYAIEAPRRRYLADALAAISAGEPPPVAATEAPGCVLERPAIGQPTAAVTYHGRVSRILARHCVECHRDGGVGPFPLDTYDDLVSHAPMVREVIDRGVMPPWFAAPTPPDPETGRVHSPWANDRSLAEAEKRDLLEWLAGGRPAGDPADGPTARTFADGWQIGTPDAVFEFAEPVTVKATGVMPYQTVIVETHLPEDRWVQAIEVQPGDRNVVHHALIHLAGAEDADDPRDEAARERGGFWGEYVPGQNTLVYPAGFAKKLPKGARLRFQMHYTPNGKATTDRTRVGVIYAKEPPEHEVRVAGIVNPRISIPPGAANHREEASLRLPFDATVIGFLPHMHVRGKACRYELIRGDGTRTTLLDIPRYDFNWQLLYRRHEPLPLQAGDTLMFTAWYDNSGGNPANPDPTKTVRWGPQTFDEMHLGYVEYFVPGAAPGDRQPRLRRQNSSRVDRSLPWVTEEAAAPRVSFHTLESRAAAGKVSYHVYAPAEYDEPNARLPVLYWLHGTLGGVAGIRPLSAHFDAAIRAGRMPPMLVVFVNGLPRRLWADSKNGSAPVETVFISELIPEIDRSFRTVAAREGRILEGFSMGGYGAARLGFRHPDLFAGLSILAGGPLDLDLDGPRARRNPRLRESLIQDVCGGDLDYFRALSPWTLAAQAAAPLREHKTVIRQAIGTADDTRDLNRAFHERMTALGIEHGYHEIPDVGHDAAAVLAALATSDGDFYRRVLSAPDAQHR